MSDSDHDYSELASGISNDSTVCLQRIIYTHDELWEIKECKASKLKPKATNKYFKSIMINTLLPVFASSHRIIERNPIDFNFNTNSNDNRNNLSSNNATGEKTPNRVHVNLSLNEDIKLNETENAWKPQSIFSKINKNTVDNVEEDETVRLELLKKIRGLLNKLTPDNFDVLLKILCEMKIDTEIKTRGFIDLVFEKAIDEPNFSETYAKLCCEFVVTRQETQIVWHKNVMSDNNISNTNNNNGIPITTKTNVGKFLSINELFRKILIQKCQREFQERIIYDSITDNEIEELISEMEALTSETKTDKMKKEELKFLIEEKLLKIRKRSVNAIRFIGELYKLNIFTVKIMNYCIDTLLETATEENLECLCKLLTTIGLKIETKTVDNAGFYLDLTSCFKKLKAIATNKRIKLNTTDDTSNSNSIVKISARTRFMILDLIDLRNNQWKPNLKMSNEKLKAKINSTEMATATASASTSSSLSSAQASTATPKTQKQKKLHK